MYVIRFIVCVLFYKPSMQYSGSILQMEDVTVQVGDDVTFHCFHPQDQMNRVMWYKQTLGGKLALVASSYFWTLKSELYDEFKESKRFRVTASVDSFNLTIQRPVQSDLATYFCAGSFTNVVYFGAGTNLVLRGSNSEKIQILPQSQREMTLSSGNVTLQCTIQIKQESCGGQHKVYWLKHSSGKTHPRIIYTQKSCKDNSHDKSCNYSLSLRNIKPSDAGTYYCAVDTCGEISFGQGIHLAFDDESKLQNSSFYILIGLAALMTISFISNVVLCVTRKKGNTSQQVQTTTDVMSSIQFSSTTDVNYAALKFTTQSSRKQREDSQKLAENSGLNL